MGTYTDSVMLRMEPKVKEDLTRRARKQGLDLSTALRMEVYRIYNDPDFVFGSLNRTYDPVESEDEAMEFTRSVSRKALNETR
jgi:antitoxin component of RelBE/YafQ-DinJ toxin-antitoxin module